MAAFKESGAVEYSSDVLMGLQRKGVGEKNAKDFNVSKIMGEKSMLIELVVLKNRNSASGKVMQFKYFPMFNYFEERWNIRRRFACVAYDF